ncbi:DNA-binding MarR family transcriptional regulator [Dysgonomonas hofstadii]|uniref:DNA-binding MarR family transcriptional regulator n=1 Tax=Dysgonomonas hofstadii TaxID=637886 RepID=A0A840CXR8_9BACT|nr:MarR family transcriptional regulator [Dysgonomonas hofstadii]MBB4037212.1 DNA-binding MarR family transcriptional regulator [Dysgonomonas hofstadii]
MGTKQHTLGFLLARASNSMATHLNSLLKKEGIDLPHSQYIVLKCLYDEDGISQQDLADKIYKDTAAIKRTLDILEKKGLIQRIPVTMRKNSVVITKQGKALMPKVMDCLERSKQIILAGIDDKEYELVVDVLDRIHQNIR